MDLKGFADSLMPDKDEILLSFYFAWGTGKNYYSILVLQDLKELSDFEAPLFITQS